MNIDELVRRGGPDLPAGWSRSSAGRQVLDDVVATGSARNSPGRTVAAHAPRRLVLAGLASTAAVVAAGAVFLTVGVGSPPPGAGPSAATGSHDEQPKTPQELFLVAAERSAATTTTSGRYWVVSREDGGPVKVGPASRPYVILERSSIESWYAMDPVDDSIVFGQDTGAAPMTAQDRAAWLADGSPSQWTLPASSPGAEPIVISGSAGPRRVLEGPYRPGSTVTLNPKGVPADEIGYELAGHGVTLDELAALPSDPKALAGVLTGKLDSSEVQKSTAATLFEAALHIVVDLPVSPQVRAAAYRMLADVKGAISLGTVRDQRGRTGMGVGYVRRDDGGNWYQTRLILDVTTGQPLAQEYWDLGSGKSPATTGRLKSSAAVVRAGFTNETPPAAAK